MWISFFLAWSGMYVSSHSQRWRHPSTLPQGRDGQGNALWQRLHALHSATGVTVTHSTRCNSILRAFSILLFCFVLFASFLIDRKNITPIIWLKVFVYMGVCVLPVFHGTSFCYIRQYIMKRWTVSDFAKWYWTRPRDHFNFKLILHGCHQGVK